MVHIGIFPLYLILGTRIFKIFEIRRSKILPINSVGMQSFGEYVKTIIIWTFYLDLVFAVSQIFRYRKQSQFQPNAIFPLKPERQDLFFDMIF